MTAERMLRPLDQVGSEVTIITAKEIALTQRRDLSALLAHAPGLNMVRTGGPGGTGSIFMRGLNANEVKVRLDGMDINDPTTPNGQFDPAQFLTDGLARVEILRGPQSGLYGGDAMGGVIDMTTQKGKGPLSAWARVEGGTYATTNQTGRLAGQTGRFHYMLELSHAHVGDYQGVPRAYRARAPGGKVASNRNDNKTGNLRLDYDVTENLNLNFTSHLTDADYSYEHDLTEPGTFLYGPSDKHDRSALKEAVLHGGARLKSFGGRLEQNLEAGYIAYHRRDVTAGTPGALRNQGDRLKADWQGLVRLGRDTTLLAGVDHLRDRLVKPPAFAGRDGKGAREIVTTAGYGQFTGNWARLLYGAANIRYDSNSRYGNYLTWRAAPAFKVPGTGLTLKASGGSGFHGPSLEQLYTKTLYVDPNPHLKAERLIGFDAGFEQKLASNHLTFGADYYENRVRHLIQYEATSGWRGSYFNVNRARTYGLEAYIDAKLLETLTLHSSYTWTVARDETTAQTLPRRPHHKIDVGLVWKPLDGLSVVPSILYVSSWRDFGRYDVGNSLLHAGPYFTFDMAASYRVNRALEIFARADNLGNRRYQNPSGYLQPRRSFYGGVRLGL